MTSPPTPTPAEAAAARARFRRTLTRVLIVQLVSLVLLGVLQIFYNR